MPGVCGTRRHLRLEYVKKVLTRTHAVDVCGRRETKSPSRPLSLQRMVDFVVENRNYDSS